MKGKRILSFILAFVMVLGMIPFNALEVYAAEVTDPTAAVVGDTIAVVGSTAEPAASNTAGTHWEGPVKSADATCGLQIHTHGDTCYYTQKLINGCGHWSDTELHASECVTKTPTTICTHSGLSLLGCPGRMDYNNTKYHYDVTINCSHVHDTSATTNCYSVGDSIGTVCPTWSLSNTSGYEHEAHTEPGCYTYTWTLAWNVYNVNVTINGNDDITATGVPATATHGTDVNFTLSATGDEYNTWTAKIGDKTFQLSATEATEVTAYGITSGDITVELTSEEVPTYSVTLEQDSLSGCSAAFAGDHEDMLPGAQVVVNVTLPAATASTVYSYAVEVTGATYTQDGNKVTVTVGETDATVKITYSVKSLSGNSPVEVEFNPNKGVAEQMVANNGTVDGEVSLEEALFDAIVKSSTGLTDVDYTDFTYEYYPDRKVSVIPAEDGWYALNGDGTNLYAFAERFKNGEEAAEKVRLTHKETGLVIEAEVTLKHTCKETSVVTPPTCTTDGYTTHTCSVCGNSNTDTPVAAQGHSEASHEGQAATCTVAGWEAYVTCARCNYTTYVEIPATNHEGTLVQVDALAATCTTDGHNAYEYCTACDYTTKVVASQTGHNMGAWYTVEGSTSCTGSTQRRDCQNEGCDHFETQDGNGSGHSLGEWTVHTAATCTTDGEERKSCANCDYYESRTLEATNHKDTLVRVEAQAATCTEAGWGAYEYCTACDHTTKVEIAALGHGHTKGLSYEDLENGKHNVVCNDCTAVTSTVNHAFNAEHKCDCGAIETFVITFVDYNGTVLSAENVEYNTMPTAPAVTAPANHTFAGWNTEVTAVSGAKTYTATYTLNAINGELEVNASVSDASEHLANLKDKVLTAAGLPTTGNYTVTTVVTVLGQDVTLTINNNGIVVQGNWGILQDSINSAAPTVLASDLSDKDTKDFTITDNTTGVSKTVTHAIKEIRLPAVIGDLTYTTTNFDTEKQFKDAVEAAIKANIKDAAGNTISPTVTFEWTEITPATREGGVTTRTYTVKANAWEGSTWLAASRTFENVSWTVNQYTVTFKDYDGTVLQEGKWDNGTTPAYSGATPTKAATAKYTYTWNGTWNAEVVAVNGADVTYTAVDDNFTSKINKYTVTWVDGDGNKLYDEQVEYDATPVYDVTKGGTPSKTGSGSTQYTWLPDQWFKDDAAESGAVTVVTGNVTYTADFSTDTVHIVTFVDEKNGTPTYGYVNETKGEKTLADIPVPNDVAYFIFAGWYKEGALFDNETQVTGDITVTAMWTEDLNDNNVLDSGELGYITIVTEPDGSGSVTLAPAENTNIVRWDEDEQKWFVLWDSRYTDVGNVTVTATPADTDGSDGEVGYVASAPASVTVSKFETTEVKAVFGTHSIDDKGKKEMLVNGHIDEKVASVTKKAVLEAILGKTLTDAEVENYEVKMYVNLGSYPIIGEINGYYDIWALADRDLGDTINATIKSALAKAIDVGGTESFEITWKEHTVEGVTYPAVTEKFDVKLTESRQPTTVTHNGTVYIATELSDALMEEIEADLTSNTTISSVVWTDPAQVLVSGTVNEVSVQVAVLETTEFYGNTHTVTVQVEAPTDDIVAKIPESAELVFNTGMTGTDKVALLLEKVPAEYYVVGSEIVANPTVSAITVQYLASTARTVPYTINIAQLDLGLAGNFLPDTIEVQIPVEELWWNMATSGADIPVYEAPSNELIKDILLNDLIPNYAADYMAGNITDEQLKQIAADLLAKHPDIANYYKFMGAHQFGELEEETIRYVINTEYGVKTTNECVLSMVDDRNETTIKLNEGVSVTYNGYTEAELLALLVDGVYANGQKVEGATVEFVTDVIGLPAADASEITVKFAGDEHNKPSEATVAIKINKAAVDVSVDNRLIKWYEGISYDLPVVTTPAGVDTINFIVGLDISDVNIDGGIKGIMGNVQLLLPEELQNLLASADSLLQAAGLDVSFANGASMKLSELQAAVEALDNVFAGTEYEEYFNVLLKMLESLPTDVADITVTVGGNMPTNIGAYLVGAVSADANYTTDMGVGIVVITPDGIKAELAWNQNDDNYIVTNTLLTTKGADGKYLFDTAAHATSVGEGGNLDDATAQIAEIFLGVDIDGSITLETDQTKLNVGAYVEVAMVANWGNQMYYSEPIARPLVVVAETLDVDFVDETGAVNNERLYEFDNTSKNGMENLLVTYKKDGNGYKAGDVVENYTVKYYYVGVQTNAVPYASTTAPTHAGAYTITAIVTVRDASGTITHAGQGIGALVIEPSKSETTVDNAAIKYDGNEHKISGLVHASSVNVPTLTPDTTVISAGISADLDNVTGLESIIGTVNVDMPSWLDKVLNKLNVLEAGYADGISAETFISYVEKIKTAMADLGVDTAAFDEIVAVIEQLPINTNLTFHDDIGYTEIGAYLVIGIVTDSDHYPSAGAGIMVIYPDATKVDLKFNKTWDDNNIFTWQYLQAYDLDAKAYDLGTENENADATAYVKNLYVGFADHGELILTADKAALDNGLYTQVAFVLDISNAPYYAEPISRVFMIVPNPATVEFIDENGNVNNDRHFVYDNTQHAMDNIRVTTADSTVLMNPEGIDIYYVGVQTNGTPYASDEAPVHAGVYEVTAQYTSRDDQDRVENLGVAIGALVIEPAKAEIDVENRAEEYEENKKHDTESMITVSSDVDVTIDKTVITVMLNTDGTFSETGLDAIQGAVNMDLPQWLDDVMANYDIFTDGLTVSEFVAGVERIKAELADLGINTQILERLVDVANQFPADTEITFHDQADVAPTAVGAYLVIGVITDSNFYPAMDAGLLVIYPAVVETQLSWIYEDVNNNNIYTEDTLDIVDLGAQADTEEDISELIRTLFIGVDVENWEITLVDSQDELNIGVYEEFAFVKPNVNSVIYYAKPISRPVIVVANVYNVSIHDQLVIHEFDNTGKDMGEITVTTASGEAVDVANGTLTVTYVGIDTQLRTYYTTEKPVHAGTYTVIATYVGKDADGDQAVGVGIGTMVIEPADADIHVESHAVLYGQDYDFVIETFHDAINDEPKTLTIMAGVDLSAFTTEGQIGIDGTVNVDFPEPVDEVLKELFPELYVNGIGTDAFFAKYDEMVAAIEARGYSADLLKQLRSMLSKLNAVNLTFNETVKPTETGLYAVVAMIFDPDYKYAVDTALIAIAPNATVAELDFNANIPSLLGMELLPYEQVADFDFGAHVGALKSTDDSLTADGIAVNDVIFGLTTDLQLFIGSSEEKPNQMGIYDQIAYVPATENALMAVLPIHRDFLITDSTANVVYVDENGYVNWLREFIYNGQPQDMGASIQLSDGTILDVVPELWYLGMDNGNVFYSSSEAPTDAGLYTVVGYYFDSVENIYTVGLGEMLIKPREVTVNVDDKTMTVGEALPELTYTVENEVESDPLKVTVSTEADGTVVGTFDITATVEENPNYKVTVNNGTLMVEEEPKNPTITTDQITLSLEGVVYLEYMVNLEGFAEDIDFATAGGVVIWDGNVNPTSKDQLQIGAEDCIILDGMYYSDLFESWAVTSTGIPAKEYGDDIYMRVYVEVAEGEYVYGPAVYYSPERYCTNMLNGGTEDPEIHEVCAALLEYGTAAQNLFDYKLDDLVNAGWDLSSYNLEFNESMIDALKAPTAELANTLTGIRQDVGPVTATLSLMGAIQIEWVYETTVEDIAKVEILVWNEEDYNNATTLAYEAETYTYCIKMEKGTLVGVDGYVATSEYIPAKAIGDTLYFSARVTTEDGTVYRSGLSYYNADRYIKNKLNSADPEIVAVVKALAVYSQKARNLFDY